MILVDAASLSGSVSTHLEITYEMLLHTAQMREPSPGCMNAMVHSTHTGGLLLDICPEALQASRVARTTGPPTQQATFLGKAGAHNDTEP